MKNGKRWDIPLDSYPSMEQSCRHSKIFAEQEGRPFLPRLSENPRNPAPTFDRYGYAAPPSFAAAGQKSHERRSALPFLRLAATVSILLLALALPLAYGLASARWPGNFLLESVVALPLVLPPTVLVSLRAHCYGSARPAREKSGNRYSAIRSPLTFAGLVLASMLYSLPFAVQPLVASFESLDRRLLDASAVLGADPARTFAASSSRSRGPAFSLLLCSASRTRSANSASC